jgi:hypothetical protein
MDHHGHRLTRLRPQRDVGAANLDIVVAVGIRCELVPDKFRQRYPQPSTGAQQFVCCCQRAKAPLERCREFGDRSAPLHCVGNDSVDGRKCILHAVIELGDQYAFAFLCPLALSHVDVDANHSAWVTIGIIGDETAPLDPANATAWEKCTIVYFILGMPLSKGVTANVFHVFTIVRVHSRLPLAA